MRVLALVAIAALSSAAFTQTPPRIYASSALLGVGGVVSDSGTTTGAPVGLSLSSPFSQAASGASWGNVYALADAQSPNDGQYRSQQVNVMNTAEYYDQITFSNPALTGQTGVITYRVRAEGSVTAQGVTQSQPSLNYARAEFGVGPAANQSNAAYFKVYGDGTVSGSNFFGQTLTFTQEFVFGQPMDMRLQLRMLVGCWADEPGMARAEVSKIQFEGITSVTVNGAPVAYSFSSLSGQPWGTPVPSFDLSLNKLVVAGQNYVQGNLSLVEPAVGDVVFTTYDDSSLVTTPAQVVVANGQTTKLFSIQVAAVNSPIMATIYAKRGVVTRSRPLTLTPLIPTALAFTPSVTTGGNTVSCRVVINGIAGPSGRTIAVFDDSPFTTMPSTVIVPPGATQVIFDIATTAVPSQKTVTVTARVSAGEKKGTFRLTP